MGYNQAKTRFGVGLLRLSFKAFFVAGFLPTLAGCYVGEGFASVDPEFFGLRPPKSPIQRIFICERTVGWELPREREGGRYLAEAEIKTVTVYAARTPMAPKAELAFIMDVNPYLLQWQFIALESGAWYFRLTVTDNDGQESEMSNEKSNEECF